MTETVLLVILLVALAEVIKNIKNNRPTLYFRTVIMPDKVGQPLYTVFPVALLYSICK